MLRAAEDRDRESVRNWRNHPLTRAASLNRHEIDIDEHSAWWDAALADPGRRIVIYERGGVSAGSVTFWNLGAEPDRRSAWWGFNLDVDGLTERDELLPAWIEIMRQAPRYGVNELCLKVLYGEVLASNQAVRRLNRQTRIREVGTYEREIDGSTEVVVRLELHAADVRRPSSTARACL